MKGPRCVQIELTDSVSHTDQAWKKTLTLSELQTALKVQDHGQPDASDRSGDVCSAAWQDGPATEVGTANGEGLRLYVEDGPNACLNVKSIVHIRFAGDKALVEPVFGSRLS
ncbi:hypothetical protein [Alicyclobacillus ferrooxydans]|uniref:Uncharacterized protein n=1 Tax=Alicyclobacillus ferrooxydans TaxID=471514 RepID=A0A0P9CM63_9BACL|nr:hypothetical protein [Alicyclobacillus ferrooxydans]KPV44059.1 hypothetical protein AN477_09210 [Alicyclobacillus ferrooxydans]